MKKLTATLLLSCASVAFGAQEWFTESIYDGWSQSYEINQKLYEQKTDHHHLIIFKNKRYGTVLALDGIIQTTERDEFVYHEMITHVPLLSHGNAQRVLIIGGGDGGSLREVLKHSTVKKVVLVDIDASVIELCKTYLPNHSQGAFDDPRTEIIIQNACEFVKNRQEQFDVIICDTTDPIGPGAQLFTTTFFGDCAHMLAPGGILVNQNEVPFMCDTYRTTCNRLHAHFNSVGSYLAPVPSYIGGFMAFGWASDEPAYLKVSEQKLEKRMQNIKGDLRYYTPAVHKASFALPQCLKGA